MHTGKTGKIYKKVFFSGRTTKRVGGGVKPSNSIAGIRRYKYWPTNYTPRILLSRSEIQSTDTQIKYKPPIVTTRLNRISYFVVYIFQSLFTFFNICTQIFTLSRSCRNSISFAYSCFISESLLYYHWLNP